jgi:hypothetical protein
LVWGSIPSLAILFALPEKNAIFLVSIDQPDSSTNRVLSEFRPPEMIRSG